MNQAIKTTQIHERYSDCFIIYTRKSTDDAENQKNSIAYQKLEIQRYCEHAQINVALFSIPGFCTDGIIEEHHSGFKQDDDFESKEDGTITYKISRPKFLALVNLLRQKKLKGVICLCWDRLSRNEGDDVLIKKLMSQGVDIRFVQANYDDTSSGALHMDIDGMFSRHYSRVISEKVKTSYKKLLLEGKCIYTAPIGYLNSGSDNKPFDPERAPIVKRICELYATDEWSFTSLAKWANKNGLTTKPYRRNRTRQEKLNGVQVEEIPKASRPVTEKTIENILNNPFYIGKLIHKGQLIDSQVHQPLIDVSLFYKIHSMLKARTRTVHYPELSFFTYRGLLKCGACQRAYSPYQQKGISYYRCQCKDDCTNAIKNINDKSITDKIIEILDRIHFTDAELAIIERESLEALSNLSEKRNKELADLHRQQRKAIDDLDYLVTDKLSLLRTGIFTPNQILDEEGRLSIKLEEINSKIKAYSESAKSMLDYVITFSELVKNASKYFKYALDSEKRELVIQAFSELYIENGVVKYIAKYGYDALLKRFDAPNSQSGSPNYVFLELSVITNSIKECLPKLKTFLSHRGRLYPNSDSIHTMC